MKYPDTAALAQEAYDASGAKSHAEFVAIFHGALSLRTFRRWRSGDGPMGTFERLILREVRDGWRPSAS